MRPELFRLATEPRVDQCPPLDRRGLRARVSCMELERDRLDRLLDRLP